MTDPHPEQLPAEPLAPSAPAKSFPPQTSVDNFNGILAYLGWDTHYNFQQLSDAVDAYLNASDTNPLDHRWIHSNFIHTSIDHADFLMAYYGCKATYTYAADGVTPTISYNPYP